MHSTSASFTAPGPFRGESELARRGAAFDWARTSLGPARAWPAALQGAVRMTLGCGFPSVTMWGDDLTMIYNDAYAALIGERHPHALGMPTHECWPETRAFHEPVYARVLAGETVHLTDVPLTTTRHGAPDEGFFTLSYYPIEDETGAIRGIQVTLVETTTEILARRLADQRDRLLDELRAERARLEAVFETSPAFFAIMRGEQLVMERVNPAFRAFSGGRVVEGRRFLEAIPEAANYDIAERILETMRTRQTHVGHEFEGFRIDPTTGGAATLFLDFVYQPLIEADGTCNSVAIHGFDVTPVVRARRELELIYKSAPVGLCVLDRDLRYLRINERLAEINGLRVEEHLGRTVREVVPGIAEPVEALARRILETGKPVLDVEIVGETPAQPGVTRIWIEQWLPLTDETGAVVAINVVAQEVTEHRRAEAEREALLIEAEKARAEADTARRAAEEANRAKSDFLAVMSHELRTPLNAIGGYAELMEAGIRGPITDAQREDLGRIQRSQRHLASLVSRVLDFARIETGTVRFEIADVVVNDVVRAAEAFVLPQMREKGIDYDFAECDAALTVRGDPEKIQQVLLNLLGNAIKFTPRGGRITVRCAARESMVDITVEDSGVGIPRDKLQRVFEPFVQVDVQYTRAQQGVGLGLAISRELVRGMGGELIADSEEGAGSRFTFTLPRVVDSGTARV